MRPPTIHRLWLIGLPLLWSGCQAISPFRQAPPTPDQPYADPRMPALVAEENQTPTARGDDLPRPGETLTLARLVALAQSHDRSTRVAWQGARAAAAAAGLSAAEYYPLLAVLTSYGGGFIDFQSTGRDNIGGALAATNLVPGSNTLVNEATGTGTVLEAGLSNTYTNFLSGAGLQWLLFDFGGRESRHRAALRDQLAANLRFNAAHQKLTYAVAELFFTLQGALREQEAARFSAESARTVLAAAQARFDQGLLTEPELRQARQVAAEADFALVNATSAVEISRVNLATAAGLPPGYAFSIASMDFRKQAAALHRPLDEHIRSALRNRPDLLAQVAVVQAAEARLRAARTAQLPTVALQAVAQFNDFAPRTSSTAPVTQVHQQFQNYGGFLTVQWPIFTGFAEQNAVRVAQASAQAAAEELHLLREQVVADVWKAYVQAKNALASLEAARAWQAASDSAYEASLAGFAKGLTTVQETLTARAAAGQAAALVAETEATIAQSFINLARSSGKL